MNNEQLITQAWALQPQLTPHSPTAVSPTAHLQRYDTGKGQLAAYLITQPQPADTNEQADLLQLFQKIEAVFNESELQDLCFRLGVNYEDVNGRSRPDKIRELITYSQRHGWLPQLVSTCADLRPHITWDSAQTYSGAAIVSKLDMAIVIDIARPASPGVAQYLDNRNLAANFVVFRHVEPGAFFAVSDDWMQFAITFGEVMDRVKREFAGARLHFFLAGPGALLFALGCVWGTVDEATIYHYEGNTYHPVLVTTRDLRRITTGWS